MLVPLPHPPSAPLLAHDEEEYNLPPSQDPSLNNSRVNTDRKMEATLLGTMATPPMLGRSVSHSSSKKPVDNVEALPAKRELQYAFEADEAGVDPVYQAKVRILNDAFQEIGMGKYQVRLISAGAAEGEGREAEDQVQWYLFVVAGFGWFS